MKDYQYLMKRSGYRSFMDVPGRRTLGGEAVIQEGRGVRGNPEKQGKYAHPADRPAVPAMARPAAQPPETDQSADNWQSAALVEVAPEARKSIQPRGDNATEAAARPIEEVVPTSIGFSVPWPQQERGAPPKDRAASNPDMPWQPEKTTRPAAPPVKETVGGLSMSGNRDTDSAGMVIYETTGLPDRITNPIYTPGYLRTQIGKLMHVDFYTGGAMVEKAGLLVQVGADYLVLAASEQGTYTICDLHSVRFVTVLNQGGRRDDGLSAIQ